MFYYRNRYHHPQLGRFVTRDPIGYEGGTPNLYEYVGGRGLLFVDPTGFGWWTDLGTFTLNNLPFVGTIWQCAGVAGLEAAKPWGTHPVHYAGIAPDCEFCKLDPVLAELRCSQLIQAELWNNIRSSFASNVAIGVVEAFVGGIAGWYSFGLGWVFAVDGLVRSGCGIISLIKMWDAARIAIRTNCKCR